MGIKCNEDFKVFMNSDEFRDSKLSNLSEADLAFFFSAVEVFQSRNPGKLLGRRNAYE